MTFPQDPGERLPRGDHDRRLALGVGRDEFAAQAGITPEQLRTYEFTLPDDEFSTEIAQRVGETLERLEAVGTPIVDNGPVPHR